MNSLYSQTEAAEAKCVRSAHNMRADLELRWETCLNQVWFSDSSDVNLCHVQTPRRGLRSGEQTQWIVFMSLLFSSGAMNEKGMLSIMPCYFF